jgi:hypothetical protein
MNNMCCYHKTIFLSVLETAKPEQSLTDIIILDFFLTSRARLALPSEMDSGGIYMVIIVILKAFFRFALFSPVLIKINLQLRLLLLSSPSLRILTRSS